MNRTDDAAGCGCGCLLALLSGSIVVLAAVGAWTLLRWLLP